MQCSRTLHQAVHKYGLHGRMHVLHLVDYTSKRMHVSLWGEPEQGMLI